MASRDLDIDIDLDVDGSELAGVNSEINALIANIERIEDNININADLNQADVLAQIQHLQDQINQTESDGINIEAHFRYMDALVELHHLDAVIEQMERDGLDINTNVEYIEALADLQLLQNRVDELEHGRADIDIQTDFNGTLAQIQHLENQIQQLDADDVFINVDLENYTGEILALRAHLQLLESQANSINLDLHTAGAHADIAALQAHLLALRAQASGAANVGGGFDIAGMLNPNMFMGAVKLTTLAIALPVVASAAQVLVGVVGTLGVAIGILAGGALALGSALAIAGAGLMGFGAIAISSISALYEENAKLTAEQKLLKVETDKVANSWGKLQDAMQPTVLEATKSGVKAINTLLNQGQPIIKRAGTAVSGLMDNLNKSMKGNDMTDFFNMMKRDVGPLTTNIGNGLGNALKGVANTMTAFAPLTRWAGQGLENAMGRFANWTSGLKNSAGLRSFIEYAQQNLPKIGSALKDATKGITNFFAAFGDSASGGLDWFKDLMADFNSWSSGLGENQGFQDMLKTISTEGPAAAEVIGNVSSSVMELTGALGKIGAIDWLANFTDLGDVKFMSWEHIWDSVKMPWSVTGDMFSGLGDAIGNALSNAFNGLGARLYESIKGSNMPSVLKDALLGVFEGFNPEIPDSVTDGMAKNFTDKLSSSLKNGSLDSGVITNDLVSDSTSMIDKQLSMFKPKVEVDADTSPAEKSIAGATKDTDSNINVDANTQPAESKINSMSAEEIQAQVDADTAAAQSKLNTLEATPIKISTDTSAIAANIGSMAATIKLSADTSSIQNSIASMPDAKIRLNADTASLTNSIGSLPDAKITLKADTIKVTNNISPVNVPANISQVNTTGLGPVKLPVTPTFAGGGTGINFTWPALPTFTWPSYPTFTWPALPTFTWPAYPTFTWPAYPTFTWPAYPTFTWPAFPTFSWPPIPAVTVNVKGAANGSHANGLGRVPFDGYIGELHRGEAVLQSGQAQALRSAGMLRGDGTNPSLDLSGAASYASSDTVSTAVVSERGSSGGNSMQVGNISITVQGSDNPKETARSVRDEIEDYFAALSEAMDIDVMEV